MNQDNNRPIFTTLLVARETQESRANCQFFSELTYRLPFRWDERIPREGELTDRFPGFRAADLVESLTWCREAMEEERSMAEEDGWDPSQGGSTADYLATMEASIRQQSEELADL